MGRLTIRGQVVNELGRPVRGARVEIWDRDNGAPDDRILTRTTNSAGVFSGVSSEWEDENYVTLPIGGRVRVPDVLDLAFKVSKQGKTHQGPFIRVNDAISAPIIWPGAPIEAVAKVNGTECDDEAKLASELKKVLQAAPNKITITIYDDVIANAFAPLANRTSRRTFVETGISGISEGIPVPTPTDAFWVLAGVAIIIVASAAAAGVVLLGSAVLYALSQGYSKVNFEHSTDNGDSTLIVNIEK